ncbi:hypothetical protein [Mucilaginibacter sp.]
MTTPGFNFDHVKNCFEHSNIFFLVCINPDGQYIYLNECFASRYRTIFGTVTGKPAINTIHPDDFEPLAAAAMECRSKPGNFYSVTLRKKDGHEGYYVTQWDLRLDETTQNIVAMGFDISEFQNKQAHIEMLNSTMRDIASVQSHMVRRPFANVLALVNLLNIDASDHENYTVLQHLKLSCKELDEEFSRFTITLPLPADDAKH